ncbi:helix-turn-helix transcriptional regulator [Pseudomonas sp. 25 R 14]|uniref:helix-turn-helix transcriptional regulator n=1 Tax=Pseudomonas sp. 25 R 14 TaxID=1844109 RepID=UPI00081282C6|nr:helix-turn-helix transcriptional regulator [Pseudomonas sp. 25 R 14]CRM75551.1 Nitrogen regulation protein C [Pseudomonas sp. 25 R 14]
MGLTLQDIAWHQSVAKLIEDLSKPRFWTSLTRLLKQYVPFDSWVVLLFSNAQPQLFAICPEADGGRVPLFQEYLKGVYQLDPFFMASRESSRDALLRLSDVAPEHFEKTDYYQRYFRLSVVADELQFNVSLDSERVFCLSLGSRQIFTPLQIATLNLIQPWVTALLRQRLMFEQELMNKAPSPAPVWQQQLEGAGQKVGLKLTVRELEVAQLMLSGCSSKEMASKLSISVETVRVHRKHIYNKLDIRSQSELFSLFLKAQEG